MPRWTYEQPMVHRRRGENYSCDQIFNSGLVTHLCSLGVLTTTMDRDIASL
jgi:hypothetical protein